MTNKRTLQDANLIRSVALPAAGATAYTAVLDTGNLTPGRISCVELLLSTSAALANLVDTKNITLTLQDSADNVTFNAAADLPSYAATGAGGIGAAAIAAQVKLPIYVNRYLRLKVVTDAAAGDNTAVSASLALVF